MRTETVTHNIHYGIYSNEPNHTDLMRYYICNNRPNHIALVRDILLQYSYEFILLFCLKAFTDLFGELRSIFATHRAFTGKLNRIQM